MCVRAKPSPKSLRAEIEFRNRAPETSRLKIGSRAQALQGGVTLGQEQGALGANFGSLGARGPVAMETEPCRTINIMFDGRGHACEDLSARGLS